MRSIKLLGLILIIGCTQNYPPIELGMHTLKIGSTLALLSVPPDYKPDSSRALLIALHGYGDNAEAFHDFWRSTADSMGVVLLTPQGTETAPIGYGWTFSGNSEMALRSCIDEVRKKVNIDSRRIYIGGFSAGGSLAYYMALKYPHVFSGIIAFGASFDPKWMDSPLGPGLIRRWRVYIGHGELEPTVSSAVDARDRLTAKGIKTELNIYKNLGHDLPEPKRAELAKALNFLLEP